MQAVDPDNKKKAGDVVRLGDVVFLTDDRNFVWRDNVSMTDDDLDHTDHTPMYLDHRHYSD